MGGAVRDPVIARRQAAIVGLSSVYSSAVAYVVLLWAARYLPAADNAEFLVFWSVLFGTFGIVTGIAAESGRSAHDGQAGGRGAPITSTGVAVGTGIAAVVAVSSIGWGERVLPQHGGLVLVATAACALYAGHLSLWGIVTGLRRWPAMAGFMAGEATVRLVAVTLVVATGGSLTALAVASAVSAGAWTVALLASPVRRLLARRSDLGPRPLARAMLAACAATSAGAALTVGFPVLISATTPIAERPATAALILAITFTRAPLLVPLTAYQGVALAFFLRHRDRGRRALLPVAGLVAGITALGAGLAWLVGPWLFAVLLAGRYAVDGATLAALVGAAGLLAVLTVTGMWCLALGRHGAYAAGWIAATLAALAALLVPGELTVRVVVSLVVGPAVGLVVHLARRPRASFAPPASTPPAPR